VTFGVFDTKSGKAVPSYLTATDKKKKLGTKSLLQVRSPWHMEFPAFDSYFSYFSET
jgi:hypothetical protein